MKLLRRIVTALLVLAAAPAAATPLVAIDVDLDTAGIQSTRDVVLGERFEVGVSIRDVEATDPLIGYEFELLFDGSVLTGLDAAPGGFLPPPSLVLDKEIGSDFVRLAEATFAPTGASGAGLLARVALEASGLGLSTLELDPLILSGRFGQAIAAEIRAAEIRVVAAPVPEPGAALTFALGTLLVGRRISRRRPPGSLPSRSRPDLRR